MLLLVLTMALLGACNQPIEKQPSKNRVLDHDTIRYAKGFQVTNHDGFSEIRITNPWPDSDVTFLYLLKKKDTILGTEANYDAVLQVPLDEIVVTSTTHIPSLEMIGEENSLIGFPNLDYISSTKTRTRIEAGEIKELGKNEALNTEILINNSPDAVITFAVDGKNSAVATIQRAGIPVLYNADWTETHPLGKAEWIKFFGLLFNKQAVADSIFKDIEAEYVAAKELAATSKTKPTVLSGALYKDIWYLPQGDSWAAQFIEDAHGNYLWSDRTGTGSLALNIESVLETAQHAEFWIGPSQYNSFEQMQAANAVYSEFDAFKNKKVYSFTHRKGATGGVIYYELAPNRPDIVLKDLISILHPEIPLNHKPYFFAPLD